VESPSDSHRASDLLLSSEANQELDVPTVVSRSLHVASRLVKIGKGQDSFLDSERSRRMIHPGMNHSSVDALSSGGLQ